MKETALAVPSTAMATCAGRNFPISETIHLRKRKQTLESLGSSVCEKRYVYAGLINILCTILLLFNLFINLKLFNFTDVKR